MVHLPWTVSKQKACAGLAVHAGRVHHLIERLCAQRGRCSAEDTPDVCLSQAHQRMQFQTLRSSSAKRSLRRDGHCSWHRLEQTLCKIPMRWGSTAARHPHLPSADTLSRAAAFARQPLLRSGGMLQHCLCQQIQPWTSTHHTLRFRSNQTRIKLGCSTSGHATNCRQQAQYAHYVHALASCQPRTLGECSSQGVLLQQRRCSQPRRGLCSAEAPGSSAALRARRCEGGPVTVAQDARQAALALTQR